MPTYIKDPDAVKDYKFDWKGQTNGLGNSDYLVSGETISSYTIIPETGITVDSGSATDTNTSVTVWLSGGTAGVSYDVTCRIVTSAGRTEDRSITIQVQEQ